jgi:hypothetical protein
VGGHTRESGDDIHENSNSVPITINDASATARLDGRSIPVTVVRASNPLLVLGLFVPSRTGYASKPHWVVLWVLMMICSMFLSCFFSLDTGSRPSALEWAQNVLIALANVLVLLGIGALFVDIRRNGGDSDALAGLWAFELQRREKQGGAEAGSPWLIGSALWSPRVVSRSALAVSGLLLFAPVEAMYFLYISSVTEAADMSPFMTALQWTMISIYGLLDFLQTYAVLLLVWVSAAALRAELVVMRRAIKSLPVDGSGDEAWSAAVLATEERLVRAFRKLSLFLTPVLLLALLDMLTSWVGLVRGQYVVETFVTILEALLDLTLCLAVWAPGAILWETAQQLRFEARVSTQGGAMRDVLFRTTESSFAVPQRILGLENTWPNALNVATAIAALTLWELLLHAT